MGQEGQTAIIPSTCLRDIRSRTFPERRKSTCSSFAEFEKSLGRCINNEFDGNDNGNGKQLVTDYDPSHGRQRLSDFLRHLKCSGYGKLSETCGLSIPELEAMATRQARQLETQEQLLAAKAQRLRFLKSSGEAERLQRLREKVASQEERLRKLRALRGKVQATRNGNSVLSADLESLRSLFNEKEKELSLAVAKVDELTRQLEDIRQDAKEQPQNGQSPAALELEKLKRELLYRHKLRESQSNRVLNQKQTLSQRQDEAMRVDRRIAELQERLNRKRILNSQLAASLKQQQQQQQENEEDFVSLPTKNDPKYQTLPYNAKLFTPFATKHDQDQFEKNMQQLQIIHPSQQNQGHGQSATMPPQPKFQVPLGRHQHQHQQQQNNQQSNHINSSTTTTNASAKDVSSQPNNSNNERIKSYNNKNNLHQFQSFLLQQSNQGPPLPNSGVPLSTGNNGAGAGAGTQMAHPLNNNANNASNSNQTTLWGKVGNENSSAFPIVRPSNFLPTGAPASSPSTSSTTSSISQTSNIIPSSQGFERNSQNGFNPQNALVQDSGFEEFSSEDKNARPALPPKPGKPAPPPRQGMELTFGASPSSRLPSTSSTDEIMIPDRTELPIKSKPLFLKNSGNLQNAITSAGSGSTAPPTSSSSSSSTTEKESSLGTANTTVRVSINRRIEMPPAFLFPEMPESDPPPSDLVPEHSSSQSSSNTSASPSSSTSSPESSGSGSGPGPQTQIAPLNQPQQLPQLLGDADFTDASPTPMIIKSGPTPSQSHPHPQGFIAEEYTLPDLFLNPPQICNFQANNKQDDDNAFSNLANNNRNPQPDVVQHNQSCSTENQQNQSHLALMNILLGPDSPSKFDGEQQEILNNNSQNQLDKLEAGESYGGKGDGGEEIPNQTEEFSEGTNNANVSGVMRRVKKSNFKSAKRDHIPLGRRVSFDPLALLLDASLEGELDLVMKTANEVGNVSAANDEGITALHNAICAGHAEVVRFLVEFGCDVNAQDSDGWTPLHCAASCNNVGMVKFLVEHGACIFATTLSDHETAAEKCEEDEDGFGPCSEYLYSIQEKLGIMNNGVVYAVFDYDAQNQDELNFPEGDRLVILRKGDEYEREWWWASAEDKQGYVPRNLLGLYPRVVPQQKTNGESDA